ncbi:unnamed protein product [Toxocara canis]|uniref:Peroxisomal ATPase PEX6 n=1 Tax=Toxocara canis TaxID=6265 RepID=A0A183UGX1_TOXCA|nr:unnamed protein product [Toxocara canis]
MGKLLEAVEGIALNEVSFSTPLFDKSVLPTGAISTIEAMQAIGETFKEEISGTKPSAVTAECVRIAMLKSPLYAESDLSAQIQDFFSIARLMSVNDVFAVEPPNRMGDSSEPVFFKVTSIERSNEVVNSFLVSTTESALYQVSSICGPVPSLLPKRYIPEPLRDVAERLHSLMLAHASVSPNRTLSVLVSGMPGSGKKLMLSYLASIGSLNVVDADCLDLWSEMAGPSEAKIKAAFHRAATYKQFCIMVLSNVDVVGLDSITGDVDCRVCACVQQCVDECDARAVVFTCERRYAATLSPSLRSLFLYEIDVPNLEERHRMEVFINELPTPNCVDLHSIARHTSGFVLAELHTVIADALYRQHATNSEVLSTEHVEWAIDVRNKSFADSVGAPKIPNVSWEDVGGLADVKAIITESLEMNLRGGKGLKRSGVILFGPPGCGKTLIAKAVASQFKVTFLSVKGPELLNKYVGQSESNVRKVFERARLASPCVVFFDELDSLAPRRGRSGDSAGVADRIVSQLLSELDSLGDSKIFVLGATNRPDLLDASLLTPGRNSREAKQCSGWMSGADLYALISRATMHAIRARVEQIESGLPQSEQCRVIITNQDLFAALSEV